MAMAPMGAPLSPSNGTTTAVLAFTPPTLSSKAASRRESPSASLVTRTSLLRMAQPMSPTPPGDGPLVDEVHRARTLLRIAQGHGAHASLARAHPLAQHGHEQLLERRGPGHRALEVEQELQVADAVLELLLGVEQLDVLLRHRHEEARVVDADGGLRGQRGGDLGGGMHGV